MDTTGTRMVSGLFKDRDSAERAYQALMDRGYDRDDVNLAMSSETRTRYDGTEIGETAASRALEGTGVGGAIGSITGGLIGAIAAIRTSLVLPGLGLVIAGPIAAGLAGAGAGGLTGGLVGAMVGWGLPKDDADEYERSVREGSTVIGVSPRNDADAEEISRAWRSCGATRVDRH